MRVVPSTKRQRILAAAVLAVLILGTAPHVAAQEATSGLIASGDSPDLFLLYTGDVIGYIEPCG